MLDKFVTKSKKNTTLLIVMGYFLISVILSIKVLLHNGVINNGDLSYSTQPGLYKDLFRYLFSDYGSLNNLENFNRPLINLVNYLIVIIFKDPIWVPRLTYIIYNFVGLVSFHFSAKGIIKYISGIKLPNIFLFLGSLLFIMSPWVMAHSQANLFWLAYVLTPIFIYLGTKFIFCKQIRYVIIAAIVLTFIGSTPQYLLFSCVFLFIWQLVLCLFLEKIEVKKFILWWIGLLTFYCLFNLNYLIPTLIILLNKAPISPGYVLTRDMFYEFGSHFKAVNILNGTQFWTSDVKEPLNFINDNIVKAARILWLLPLIILFFKKNNRYIILLIISLLPLTVSEFYNYFIFLFFSLPFVSWFFRDPSKLVYIFWLFIPLAIILSLYLIQKQLRSKTVTYIIVVAFLVALFLGVANQVYVFYFSRIVPTPLEESYEELNQFLTSPEYKDGRIILLAPYHYAMGKNKIMFETSFVWAQDKIVSHINHYFPVPSIGYYHFTLRNWQSSVYKEIYPEFGPADPNSSIPSDLGKNYLSKINVRYLVFHNDILGGENQGEKAIQIISEKTDLKFLRKFGKYIYLFENPYYKEMIYANEPDSIGQIQKINPTEYKFSANIKSDKPVIFFAQNFDYLWTMKINGHTYKPIESKDMDLTQFEINEKGELTGEIYYLPQKYYEIGFVASSLILVISIAGLLIVSYKNKKMEA